MFFSLHTKRAGVWIAIISVLLSKAEVPCCKDVL